MPGQTVRDRAAMIAGMAPVLDGEIWHFCTQPAAMPIPPEALASFQEEEGCSLILREADAKRLGLTTDLPMARITLTVNSALDGVGLTAAVATALAEEGVACNMVSAYHHDHAFVPFDAARLAMAILRDLAGGDG